MTMHNGAGTPSEHAAPADPGRPADTDRVPQTGAATTTTPERDAAATPDVDAVLDEVVSAMGGARREGQHQMAGELARALQNDEHLLIQAGTGTGKSLAYLIPALLHTVQHSERAVVSTATLALQRQILRSEERRVGRERRARRGAHHSRTTQRRAKNRDEHTTRGGGRVQI